jgi:integrase
MARSRGGKGKRERGSIDSLPSGALRVRVYSGTDPITHKPHYLTEIIPAGTPGADDLAENVRTRFLNEVNERRNPRTNATVDRLLSRYLDQFVGSANTIRRHRGDVQKHLGPFLGHIKIGALDAEILDAFYAECRRCNDHCDRRPRVDHRTDRPHECDHRCGPHKCEPLSESSIRHMHYLLSGAYKHAIRWRWVAVNPVLQTEPPVSPAPNPAPPTPEQAARIVNAAYKDADWGTFIWTAMTTGARRGEMCALRWVDLNLDPEQGLAWIRRAISLDMDKRWVESDTKTHQQRRVALDPETAVFLDLGTDHQLSLPTSLTVPPSPVESTPQARRSPARRMRILCYRTVTQTQLFARDAAARCTRTFSRRAVGRTGKTSAATSSMIRSPPRSARRWRCSVVRPAARPNRTSIRRALVGRGWQSLSGAIVTDPVGIRSGSQFGVYGEAAGGAMWTDVYTPSSDWSGWQSLGGDLS